jgi:hypothetical protein
LAFESDLGSCGFFGLVGAGFAAAGDGVGVGVGFGVGLATPLFVRKRKLYWRFCRNTVATDLYQLLQYYDRICNRIFNIIEAMNTWRFRSSQVTPRRLSSIITSTNSE